MKQKGGITYEKGRQSTVGIFVLVMYQAATDVN